MNVYTYICIMTIEEALKTTRFADERHKATLNVLYTSYWLRKNASSALKEVGITLEQYNVLRILRGSHPRQMCVKDIGSRMIEKSSNVPRIIDKLLLKELVQRVQSEEDKRETLVFLTDKGTELLVQASKLVTDSTHNIVGISEEDAKTLNDILEKMRTAE